MSTFSRRPEPRSVLCRICCCADLPRTSSELMSQNAKFSFCSPAAARRGDRGATGLRADRGAQLPCLGESPSADKHPNERRTRWTSRPASSPETVISVRRARKRRPRVRAAPARQKSAASAEWARRLEAEGGLHDRSVARSTAFAIGQRYFPRYARPPIHPSLRTHLLLRPDPPAGRAGNHPCRHSSRTDPPAPHTSAAAPGCAVRRPRPRSPPPPTPPPSAECR